MIFHFLFFDSYLRDRGALFWIFVFPTLMYLVFSTIFGGMGKEMELKLGIVGESRYFSEVLKHMGMDITVEKFEDVDSMKKALEDGKIDIGIDLRGFDRSLLLSVLSSGKVKTRVTIYHTDDELSKTAKDVFGNILGSADLEMEKLTGKAKELKVIYEEVEGRISPEEFYLGMGVVMALLGAGIFGVAFTTADQRMKGVFKYLKITPLGDVKFFTEGMLVHLIASWGSAGIVLAVGMMRGIDLDVVRTIVVMVLGAFTFTSIGTLISLLSRDWNFTNLVANLTYFVMMFTGNLFFRVEGFMKIISGVNPVTCVADILRNGFGSVMDFIVPLIWFSFSAVLSIHLLRRGALV